LWYRVVLQEYLVVFDIFSSSSMVLTAKYFLEFMEVLRLNKKGNKDKGKIVEEKKKSGMETALNAFEKGGRERKVRGRGKRGERGRGVGADST
jgi:hypothetical protein